jgi:hypothetical protein
MVPEEIKRNNFSLLSGEITCAWRDVVFRAVLREPDTSERAALKLRGSNFGAASL